MATQSWRSWAAFYGNCHVVVRCLCAAGLFLLTTHARAHTAREYVFRGVRPAITCDGCSVFTWGSPPLLPFPPPRPVLPAPCTCQGDHIYSYDDGLDITILDWEMPLFHQIYYFFFVRLEESVMVVTAPCLRTGLVCACPCPG